MSVYRRSNVVVDLTPFVEEAIATLGFVRTERLDWLAAEIGAKHGENNGRAIREGGTRLSKEQRAAYGLTRWDGHLSCEVWDALTETGRIDPVRNFDDTCSRAVRNAYLQVRRTVDQEHLRDSWLFGAIEFRVGPQLGCDAAMQLHRRVLTEIPELPFAGCDRRICACDWYLLTQRELERR